jgi:hypothetical protein
MLKPGIYKHYKGAKGGEYLLIGVAGDENNRGKYLAIYQGLYDDRPIFARPLEQFTEDVEWDGNTVPRFEWIRENE